MQESDYRECRELGGREVVLSRWKYCEKWRGTGGEMGVKTNRMGKKVRDEFKGLTGET